MTRKQRLGEFDWENSNFRRREEKNHAMAKTLPAFKCRLKTSVQINMVFLRPILVRSVQFRLTVASNRGLETRKARIDDMLFIASQVRNISKFSTLLRTAVTVFLKMRNKFGVVSVQ